MNISNTKSNIIKCPICRREYGSRTIYDFKPILFKIVFRNNIELGFIHPLQLFYFTSKTHLHLNNCSGDYTFQDTWISKMRIIFDILHMKYTSDTVAEPSLLYIYKEGELSFTLKFKKPADDFELTGFHDFDNCLKQNEDIVKSFVERELNNYYKK